LLGLGYEPIVLLGLGKDTDKFSFTRIGLSEGAREAGDQNPTKSSVKRRRRARSRANIGSKLIIIQ
jgi:hypothetical protein